jgi:hypothetical protein
MIFGASAVSAAAERLEVHPSMAKDGRQVFSNLIQSDDVWLPRLDQDAAQPPPLIRITESPCRFDRNAIRLPSSEIDGIVSELELPSGARSRRTPSSSVRRRSMRRLSPSLPPWRTRFSIRLRDNGKHLAGGAASQRGFAVRRQIARPDLIVTSGEIA